MSSDLIIGENEGCHELHKTLVELWEKDTFSTDDKLNSIFTHKNDSRFVLYGSEELDPVVVFYLKSYHTCQVSVDDVIRVRINLINFTEYPKSGNFMIFAQSFQMFSSFLIFIKITI